jgi:hypothetical protein
MKKLVLTVFSVVVVSLIGCFGCNTGGKNMQTTISNEHWTENNSGVNGQPSLIYHAKFIAGISGKIKLNPIGHGSVNGSNGNIVYALDSFTTALTIIKDTNEAVPKPCALAHSQLVLEQAQI